jgi:hypothetical protein
VVQKAFEHVLKDQRDRLVGELNGKVIDCVKDNNGNHVIQVCSLFVTTLY